MLLMKIPFVDIAYGTYKKIKLRYWDELDTYFVHRN